MTDVSSQPIPAATVIVMRERGAAQPELLMVERAGTMAFAGGALVFPGGRIDSGDRALAATLAGDPEDLAARIAAIRETIEEAGVAIGIGGRTDQDQIETARRRLEDGVPIGPILADLRWRLELGGLVPFARWCPRHLHARIFDTRFYLARLPDDAPPARVDASENVRLAWMSADQALLAKRRGEARIVFPTQRNLERLARFRTFAEATDDARRHPIETVTPWIEPRDGADHLCIPDGLGYPVTSEPLAGMDRF